MMIYNRPIGGFRDCEAGDPNRLRALLEKFLLTKRILQIVFR